MAEDWPSPHHHEPHPLPRVEDLPIAWEGYDRERVQAAFDGFYRHIAQLDATLRALESVEAFRTQAGDLRAELRSLRAAGWAPYPRGYTLTPERSMLGSVPEAVPRIALEVVFLVIVAVVVAVANFSALMIVGVMAVAVLLTFLVELIAARERRATTPIPPAASAPPPTAPAAHVEVVRTRSAVVEQQSTEADEQAAAIPAPARAEADSPADDGSGWAAFAEPAGPELLSVMGALAVEDEVVEMSPPEPAEAPVAEETPEAESESPIEPKLEPQAELEPEPEFEQADVAEAETGTIQRHRRFRRAKPEEQEPPHERAPAPAPKHVRVLPPPETAVVEAELPPWERGFDETDERR